MTQVIIQDLEVQVQEFRKSDKPIGLELPFSFFLKNGVKVFGKIDRVDKLEKGIEIIDYKTGILTFSTLMLFQYGY